MAKSRGAEQDEVRFDGRAVVVTGAARGMGLLHAQLLASRGAKVVVADYGGSMDGRDSSDGPATLAAKEINASGGEAVAYAADLSVEEGAVGAIDACLSAFGRIDGLLHNASTSPNQASADSISSRDLDVLMRINPYSAHWLTRAAWPSMKQQGFGRIVLISSHGIFGAELCSPYAAAKSSYIGMMRALAPEGERAGIAINVVLPSARTRMSERMPSTEYGEWLLSTMAPERVSPAVVYLLSEHNSVTGEAFSIGGGRMSRVVIGESRGLIGSSESIEDVRDALPSILAETTFDFPKNLTERSIGVARQMGYTGEFAADAYAIADLNERLPPD